MYQNLNLLFALPLFALILSCAACSSTEQKQAQLQPLDADGVPILTEEQKEQGIICKREPVTGSRISKRTCTTPEQRERNQRLGEEAVNETQRRNTGPTIFQ